MKFLIFLFIAILEYNSIDQFIISEGEDSQDEYCARLDDG